MQTRLGSYNLLAELGAGAMGVVYRAQHAQTGVEYALKVIAPGFASNEVLVARFQREMAIIQKLMHPHIVRCFETGADGPQRFFVMELVEGGSIGTLLQRKERLSWQETIYYAIQVCSALEYAHQHGVIHRDLKPANLLLDRGGSLLKLADFGLALDPDATALTAAGRTVGTVNYMAPEQIRGKPPVSPQTDLYSLGCVMFEMLTGFPPFDAESPAESMHKQLDTRPQRVSAVVLDCPIWLDKLILKLLEKEPLQRPADAHTVAHSLRQIQDRMAAGATVLHFGSDAGSRTVSGRGPVIAAQDRKRRRFFARSMYRQPWLLVSCIVALIMSTSWAVWLGMGGSGSRAESLWIDSLHHSEKVVREEATRALGQLGPSKHAVAALIEALDDSEPNVRAGAVRALEQIGSDASSAIPALTRLSKSDAHEPVRMLAVHALGSVRSSSGSSGLTVIAYIAPVAAAAMALAALAWARRRFGPTAVPILIEDLKSNRVAVRRRATRILSLLGPNANEAVPALLLALKDGDEGVRHGADVALGKIGLHNKRAVPDLIAALRDKDPFVRTRAAVLLGKLGPAAKAAIPTLIEVLKDPIDLVRVEAVQSLGRIDVEANQAIPHLSRAIHDRSYSVRRAATSLLRQMRSARGDAEI
jgi:serine/threonine-protein kinase